MTTVYSVSSGNGVTGRASLYLGEYASLYIGLTTETLKTWLPFVVNLPKNERITTATLKIYANESLSGATCKCLFGCEAADSPAAPTNWATLNARVMTTAYTTDNNVSSETAGALYSWDITTAVQEILNRAGWVANNTLAILMHDNGSSSMAYRGLANANSAYTDPVLEVVYGGAVGVAITPYMMF